MEILNIWDGGIGIGDKFLLVLCAIAVILFLYTIIHCVLWGIDSLFRPKLGGYAVLVGKEFIPEHIETYMISMFNGKTFTQVPQQRVIPDDWVLTFEIKNRTGFMSIPQEIFDLVEIGSSYFVKYSTGRIWSRSLYLSEIIM
jgi:hypothetical protein